MGESSFHNSRGPATWHMPRGTSCQLIRGLVKPHLREYYLPSYFYTQLFGISHLKTNCILGFYTCENRKRENLIDSGKKASSFLLPLSALISDLFRVSCLMKMLTVVKLVYSLKALWSMKDTHSMITTNFTCCAKSDHGMEEEFQHDMFSCPDVVGVEVSSLNSLTILSSHSIISPEVSSCAFWVSTPSRQCHLLSSRTVASEHNEPMNNSPTQNQRTNHTKLTKDTHTRREEKELQQSEWVPRSSD